MIFAAFASLALNAQPQQGNQGNPLMMLLPFVFVFAIFYLLIIMPQRKKQKKHMEMVDSLRPGARVITTAGIFGTVMGVQKDFVELKISSNTNVRITKSAIAVIRGETDRLEGE